MTSAEDPSLDVAGLLELVSGDHAFLRELTQMFRDQLPDLRAALETAVVARQAPDVREAAHALKGALANLCATPARDLAYELETMGRTGALDTAPEVLDRLEHELGRLLGFLERLDEAPEPS